MNITITYYGQARILAGTRSETVQVPDNATPLAALRTIAASHGEAFDQLIFSPEGLLKRSVLLAVNGVVPRPGSESCLKNGDEISVQTAIAGG